MVFVEAHFLQRAELKLDSFGQERGAEALKGYTTLKVSQVNHLVN